MTLIAGLTDDLKFYSISLAMRAYEAVNTLYVFTIIAISCIDSG